jgi:uncharacterized repeat protein (TIGR03803 family)
LGDSGNGTVFKLGPDGNGFTVVYSFHGAGALPYGGTLCGNTFYGTASAGGYGNGSVFSISLSPQLSIAQSGVDAILTWPTNFAGIDYTGFTLQSATNLMSPVWSTNLPSPVVVNGQNTLTNPISGAPQFFRLSQ